MLNQKDLNLLEVLYASLLFPGRNLKTFWRILKKWGSKNRRNVFKLRPGNNNDAYNTSSKSESFWFSSYRDIGQKRNSRTKSLKSSISQRRIRLLDLLTSSQGLLWIKYISFAYHDQLACRVLILVSCVSLYIVLPCHADMPMNWRSKMRNNRCEQLWQTPGIIHCCKVAKFWASSDLY